MGRVPPTVPRNCVCVPTQKVLSLEPEAAAIGALRGLLLDYVGSFADCYVGFVGAFVG